MSFQLASLIESGLNRAKSEMHFLPKKQDKIGLDCQARNLVTDPITNDD
jgi:hypothetical protein